MAKGLTKGAQTRLDIIAKAAPLFNRKGYEGTSLADLMNATGLKKGGIYRHFSGKQELAAAAFDHSWQTAVHLRLEDTDQVANSVDRLKRMIANFVEKRTGLVPGGCPLLNTAIEADDGNPVLRRRARKALETWTARLTKVASDGIRKREIDPHIDSLKLAQKIIGSLEGALMISRLTGTEVPSQDARNSLNAYLDQNVRLKSI